MLLTTSIIMDKLMALWPKFRGIVGEHQLVILGLVTLCYWLALGYSRSETRKLRGIPSAGPDIPVISYIGSLMFLMDACKVVDSGFKRWGPTTIFKVPDLLQWNVIIAEPKDVEELRKAPEHVLSAFQAIQNSIQADLTLGAHHTENPYHLAILRTKLTRALPQLVPAVHAEVIRSFAKHIPATEDWTSVKVYDTVMNVVAPASNRVLVGLPLCRDPDYLKLNVEFVMDVVKASTILRLVPAFLRRIVNPLVSNTNKRHYQGVKFLKPIIDARRKVRAEKGRDYEGKEPDLLNWLMDEATGKEAEDWYLTSRILMVNFAAIHTSTMTFTHAFYYLAAKPEYLVPLREEVEEAIRHHGWTKEAMDKMYKVDSFIKESQRLHTLGNVLLNRVAVKDFTFSDGTVIPAGTTVGVAIHKLHYNEKVYEDPMTFDPFRFVKMKEAADQKGETDKRFDMVTTSIDGLQFGIGRHACPGRFFAASELKLMLAHVVVTYDVKLEKEGIRPADKWFGINCIPNPTAEVLFRKRRLV